MNPEDRRLRVILLTGVEPAIIARLTEQLDREVPDAVVTGILYTIQQRLKTKERIVRLMGQLRDPEYARYVLSRVRTSLRRIVDRVLTATQRFLHAYSPPRDRGEFGLGRLAEFCEARGIGLLVTSEVHDEASLAFVRDQSPDLGVVYGTPILKPKLFKIPRLGSVNVHQRKVPDYRGGGAVGLWELLDDRREIGVTVHRVLKQLDAGAVIRSGTIPIEPFDNLESLALKAHVVSIDLLTLTIADFSRGDVRETLQSGPSRMFRTPDPRELRRHLERLASTRPKYVPSLGWPAWKLIAKMILFGPLAAVRNWRRRLTGRFPVVILYHHVITDRPHFLGLPTSQFLRHLEFLGRFYDLVDMETAIARLRSGRVDSPTVVLSFDDGYGDNFLTLRAATLRHDIRATLFVCPRQITEQLPFDHDTKRGIEGFVFLTWEEVRKLQTYGFRIASHTRTHLDCGSTDQDRLRDEIVESRKDIEEHLGHPIPHFSFPFGQPRNMSRRAIDLARDTYDLVCSAYGGENPPHGAGSDWHAFRRFHTESVWELALSLQSLLHREQPPLWMGESPADDKNLGRVPSANAR